MATITEIVEREAAEAEAETPDDAEEAEMTETTNEPEPEPEPEPAPPPSSDKEWAALLKKMDAESERHEKRLKDLLGADWPLYKECPLCPVPGYVYSIPAGPINPEQRMAVLTAMGDTAEPVLKTHENWYACPTCDGYGDISTGSKRAGADKDQCPDCGGKGYRRRDFDRAAIPTYSTAPAPAPVEQLAQFNTNGAPDQWGRPQGHPHYGIDPRYAGIGG